MSSQENIERKMEYLRELRTVRENYMVSDFGKYLNESRKIIEKYDSDFNGMYPPLEKDS